MYNKRALLRTIMDKSLLDSNAVFIFLYHFWVLSWNSASCSKISCTFTPASLPHTPCTMLKLGKNSVHTSPTLFVGWGEGLGSCELQNLTLQKWKRVPRLLSMSVAFSYWVRIFLTDGRRWKLGQTYFSRALALCAQSRAPWVRKCGYLCI